VTTPLHGGYSTVQIAKRARNHKRRLLRKLRTRASDLDAVTGERLDLYVRTRAQLDLLPRDSSAYLTATNSCDRLLRRLEDRLAEVGLDTAGCGTTRPGAALEQYLAERANGPARQEAGRS